MRSPSHARNIGEKRSHARADNRRQRRRRRTFCREASGGLETRQEALARLGDEIDGLKQQIDEQGAQNVNGAPIARVTQAIAKLEHSILVMNVQSAAIEQSLYAASLNDRINVFA